jgi:phosphoribosylformylglycinamidine synthase
VAEFSVDVRVIPRRGILDPQGQAVEGALRSLGFERIQEVHVGRLIVLQLDADDEAEARALAEAMCRKLLANPVTEDFTVDVTETGMGAP